MNQDEELEQLRRLVQTDPADEDLMRRYRAALDRVHGPRPICQRCRLSTHMVRGRLMTKAYHNWTENAVSEFERSMGFKPSLHLVGWRCRICNIVSLATVDRRDKTFDWVDDET